MLKTLRCLSHKSSLLIKSSCNGQQRRFSAEPSAEEKAAVVHQGLKGWAKKYGIILFPSLFMTILTIDIVSNISHRKWLEDKWPFIVQLVREKYGFDDEDEEERIRMISMREHYLKPVTVHIGKDDSKIVITLPSGTTRLEDIVFNDPQVVGYFRSIRDIYCSYLISFPDHGDQAAGQFADPKPLQRRPFEEDPKSVSVCNESWVQNSLWNTEIFANQCKTDPKSIYFFKYENVAIQFFSGIALYRKYGHANVMLHSHDDTAQSGSHVQTKKRRGNDKNMLRQIALEKIQLLENEIKELNREKRFGFRDTDSIDQDIERRNNEITQLRRAYVNLFYFF